MEARVYALPPQGTPSTLSALSSPSPGDEIHRSGPPCSTLWPCPPSGSPRRGPRLASRLIHEGAEGAVQGRPEPRPVR